MRIECENCSAHYTIDDEQVGDQAIGAQCPFCGHVQVVSLAAPSDLGFGTGYPEYSQDNDPALFELPDDSGISTAQAEQAFGFNATDHPYPPSAPLSSPLNMPVSAPELEPMIPALDHGGLNPPPPSSRKTSRLDGLMGNSPGDVGIGAPPEATAAGDAVCQVCQTPLTDEFDRVLGLCELHQKGEDAAAATSMTEAMVDTDHWFVRLVGGAVRGPLALPSLQQMIRSGEVPTDAEFSKSGVDYQPIATFPELAVLAPASPAPLAPRRKVAYRRPFPSQPVIIVVVLIAVGGFGYRYRSQLMRLYEGMTADLSKTLPGRANPLRRYVAEWRATMSDISGTSQEHLQVGIEQHILDTPEGYREAEDAFKRALLLDENNADAMSAYVENMALWRYHRLSSEEVELTRRVLEYALELAPDSPSVRRAAGALGLVAGDLNGCRSGGEAALDLDPTDARARLILASCYMQGNVQLALQELELAQKSMKDLRRSKRVLGEALRRGGWFRSAIQVLERALEEAPNNPALHFELGEVYFALAELPKARRSYAKAASLDGDSQIALTRLGETELYQSNPDGALRFFEEAVKASVPLRQRGARLFALMGQAELMRDGASRAFEFAKRALELDPKSIDALLVAAEAQLEAKQVDEAEPFVLRAMKERDQEPAILMLASLVANRKDENDKAMDYLRTALQRDPKNVQVAAALAGQQLAAGGAAQAYGTMRRAADIDPARYRSAPQPDKLGVSRAVIRQALERFEGSSQERRNTAVAFASMALVYHTAGQASSAQRFADRSLQVDDANILAGIEKIFFLTEAGALQKGLRLASRLLSVEKGNALISLLRGRIYRRIGESKKARRDFEAALRGNPGLLAAEVELASLNLDEGENEAEARATLARAFTVAPELLYLRRILFEHDAGTASEPAR